jgi:DNA uptake protein ComE-like DNA-binding protein
MTGESRDVARRVDLNTASERELARLPGLTDDDAGRIVANRPYGDTRGLLRKNVIGPGKYDQIEDYVHASQPRRRDDRY